MGELEEKEVPSTESQINDHHHREPEEPKETDKMLDKKSDEVNTNKTDDATKRSTTPEKCENKNGDDIINIPNDDPERDNDGNTIRNTTELEEKLNPVTKEGREVKPKKIPIGGIKMPGFFMKAKPREDGDGAEGELLEKDLNQTSPTVEEKDKPIKKDQKQRPCIGDRIRSLFVRKPKSSSDDGGKRDLTAEATDENGPPKRGLLNAIKLPIANMIPKKKTEDDVELGCGPGTKAGLASMETLDDSLKDQDTVDRAPPKKNDEISKTKGSQEIKTVGEKSPEEDEEISCFDRIRSYRCSVDDALITLGILLIIILLIVIGYVLTSESQSSPPLRDGRFIEAVTGCGMVEGVKEDGAFAFRGIPYALPPIDENRFKPAKLIENIDDCWNGTLKTHNTTEVCTQMLSNGKIVGDEDCLTLDLITPQIRYDNPLPVVVLIGANSLTGDSPGILRPSARYARLHDVIFVRPNFRLGVFGFLAVDFLTKDTYPRTSGNYALTDIIAVLHWIKLNIGHFGGDPESVTLFGHRAGATLVSALVTSKKIKNLYARAWVSSGSAVFPSFSLSEYERRNQDFLNQLNCFDMNCLSEASTSNIWNATPDTWLRFPPELPKNDENNTAQHNWLTLDGHILQEHPSNVWKKETDGKPKLVIGTTAHESHTELLQKRHMNWTEDEVRAYIENSKIGAMNLTDEVIQIYNATYKGLVSIISDIRTICPLLENVREQSSTPFYVVTQGEGPDDLAKIDADVQAILGRYETNTVQQRRYMTSMQQLFYYYVSHGEFTHFKPQQRVLNVGQDPNPQEDYPNCAFWKKHNFVPQYARID